MPFQFLTLNMLPVSFPASPFLSLVFLNFIVKCLDVGFFLFFFFDTLYWLLGGLFY